MKQSEIITVLGNAVSNGDIPLETAMTELENILNNKSDPILNLILFLGSRGWSIDHFDAVNVSKIPVDMLAKHFHEVLLEGRIGKVISPELEHFLKTNLIKIQAMREKTVGEIHIVDCLVEERE